MEKILEKIRDFADQSHGSQMRKYAPDRYIVHPVRVMEICRKYTQELPVLAAAILHDVLEDTAVTEEELHAFLRTVMDESQAAKTIRLVVELTDVYVKESFPELNRKKRKALELERMKAISADAQTVKYADILDNSDEIVEQDPDFARVFLHECRRLLAGMNAGNPGLHALAMESVEKLLAALRKQRP